MKRALIITSLLIVAVIGGVLAYLNAEVVTFNYYFSSSSLPLAALLFLVFVVGVFIGALLTFSVVVRLRREKKQIKKQLKVYEQEIKNLRDIPIKGSF